MAAVTLPFRKKPVTLWRWWLAKWFPIKYATEFGNVITIRRPD